MIQYQEKANRMDWVRARMNRLLALVEEYQALSTQEYARLSKNRLAHQDLQRLWEEGLVCRYKIPDARDFFDVPNASRSWHWVTIEEMEFWNAEDEAYAVASPEAFAFYGT